MTARVLVFETLTGRITDTLDGSHLIGNPRWTSTLNQPGSVESVTVSEAVVRDLDLRNRTQGMRTSLAFERDDRIKQAGPITTRSWDWEKGQATFGAKGIWGWLDQRVIRPAVATVPLQKNVFTVTDKSLGGIARALVERAIGATYCDVPIVLPDDEAGTRTESWPLWSLARYGEQLRQITQRATDAPDIAFRPRRRGDDPRYIEWVMNVGTEIVPALYQAGPDWVFDTSAPKSPVLGITTDEDATVMAQQAFTTGNGQEEDILMAFAADPALCELGWPLTEADESHSTVELQDTLQGHADNLLGRVARPVEVFKVSVRTEAAAEVEAGDYCRVITVGDPWLGAMDKTMRVRQIAGDSTDTVVLDMFPLQADL